MPVIQLIVAVCLASDPTVCSERRFSFIEPSTTFSCMSQAIPYLARWASRNEEWTIVTWRCGYPDTDRDA